MRQDRYLRVYYEPGCGYWHLTSQPVRTVKKSGGFGAGIDTSIGPELEKIKREGWFPSLVFFVVVIAILYGLAELLN